MKVKYVKKLLLSEIKKVADNHYRFVPNIVTFDYLPINNRKNDPAK